ncbi:MAG: single-stranded-DNA-specific exonuclease RecJ [Alphaproteobacteria bacterium]|nr:single-stranded-DNA-specific exonuclease RecJ [Alphaproteobacteria bacterium]
MPLSESYSSTSSVSSTQSRTGKVWIHPQDCERTILFLKQKYDISDMAARLAYHRLNSLDEADEIFSPYLRHQLPDPSFLPDAELAFEHTFACLLDKKPVGVWGDYDVDGACSAALLVKYFQALDIPVSPYIPDRFQEGYGPNAAGLLSIKEQGIDTVFIVDCGTTAFQPLAAAKEYGLTVIIIDHHRVAPEHPICHALINPKRADYTGPLLLQQLCAGGLVFLFLVGLNRYLRDQNYFDQNGISEPDLYSFLDLVALSTICDMMPLRHINRAFVKQGLKVMRKRHNVGLTCLTDACRIKGVPSPIHLGYTIGPRINAGGRIGDASLGVRLLSCDDKPAAIQMAQELNQLNQERQAIERSTLEQAMQQAQMQKDKPYIFVFGDHWHEGVLGIMASHIKEAFFKPSFVLTVKGSWLKGSVRSIPGMDIADLIHRACQNNLLVTGGGHPMAGGLTVEREKLDELLVFIDQFFQECESTPESPTIPIDMAITFEQLRAPEFFNALDYVGPFGADYPQPKFLASNLLLENVKPFGYNHLRMYGIQPNGQSHAMVFFRQADKEIGQWLLSKPSHRVDCLLTIQSEYRWGYQRALLIIEDIATC